MDSVYLIVQCPMVYGIGALPYLLPSSCLIHEVKPVMKDQIFGNFGGISAKDTIYVSVILFALNCILIIAVHCFV